MALLPLTDYLLTLSLTEVGSKGAHFRTSRYLSCRQLKEGVRARLRCEEVSLEVQLVNDQTEKQRLVELMNYKFKYPLSPAVPLLRVYGLEVALPQELELNEEEEDAGFLL